MKHKYLTVSGATDIHGRFIKRPIAQIEVSHGSLRRTFLALLDSGADSIILPAAIAEAFGIDRTACRQHTTIGISMQPIVGFIAPVTIRGRARRRRCSRTVAATLGSATPATAENVGAFSRTLCAERHSSSVATGTTGLPADRATSEATAPGSIAAATIRSFSARDQRRRPLHRCDHLDLRLRHRANPRNTRNLPPPAHRRPTPDIEQSEGRP